MPKTYNNNSRRPSAYYELVINHLIRMNNDTLTYAAMATELNALDIPTPTGLQWNSEHIKNLLKKLRTYKTKPSFIAQHLLELVFEHKLTIKETLPLFKSRRHGVM